MPPRICIGIASFQCSARRAFPSKMPLRAKILVPSTLSSRASSTASQISQGASGGGDELDVLFDKHYSVRTITLNRPKKLNALNGSMARKILDRLQEWEKSQLANTIILKGTGKALCAGGDVATLASEIAKGSEGLDKSREFFTLEYQLDHYIATYPKPYVAFMDGITMGGGAGLSMHGPFRIATENTVFAMPETRIGLFPDVGAGFFLPRLDGQIGTYLALTGAHVKGVNALYHGIASHYIHSTSLPQLEARLAELVFKDYYSIDERNEIVSQTIDEFATGLPYDEPMELAGEIRQKIDHYFDPAEFMSINEIVAALEARVLEDSNDEWARDTLERLKERSPTSLAVTLRQMRDGIGWDIAEAFQREYNLASRFIEHPDFEEGVSSLLIRRSKERPNWQPSTVKNVQSADIDKFFSDPPSLKLLRQMDRSKYRTYPHAKFSLPTEFDIVKLIRDQEMVDQVNKGTMTVEGMMEACAQYYGYKPGVREKVEEVIRRRTASKA